MVTRDTIINCVLGAVAFVIIVLLLLFIFPQSWRDFIMDEQWFWFFVVITFVGLIALVYGIRKLLS